MSLYDGTVEGLDFPELRARSAQFHPEAGPGPHDARPIISLGRGGAAAAAENRPRVDLPHRLRADRDRAGLRVRLRRLPGAQGAARGRLPHDRRQLEPGDDHDRPRLRRPHVLEPLDLEGVAGVLERERPDALLPTMGGQTALNLARELARPASSTSSASS